MLTPERGMLGVTTFVVPRVDSVGVEIDEPVRELEPIVRGGVGVDVGEELE